MNFEDVEDRDGELDGLLAISGDVELCFQASGCPGMSGHHLA